MAGGLGGGLSGVAIRRPVFTAMLMIALVVLGYSGYRRLPIDLMPNVEFPVVAVTVVYPGASPETIERAKRLLLETTYPISKVAQIAGFGSTGYFIEFFQRRLGKTPRQYRIELAI